MNSAEYMHASTTDSSKPVSTVCAVEGEGGGALGYSPMPGCRVPAQGTCPGHRLGCADLAQRGCVQKTEASARFRRAPQGVSNGTASDGSIAPRRRRLLQGGDGAGRSLLQQPPPQQQQLTVYYAIGNVQGGHVDTTAAALAQPATVQAFRRLLVRNGAPLPCVAEADALHIPPRGPPACFSATRLCRRGQVTSGFDASSPLKPRSYPFAPAGVSPSNSTAQRHCAACQCPPAAACLQR